MDKIKPSKFRMPRVKCSHNKRYVLLSKDIFSIFLEYRFLYQIKNIQDFPEAIILSKRKKYWYTFQVENYIKKYEPFRYDHFKKYIESE